MKRYFHALLYGLGTLLAGYAIFIVASIVCHWFYEALIDWFPTLFKDYSPVLNSDKYFFVALVEKMLASVLSIALAAILVTRHDNGRDEFIIQKTEGFYRINEVIPMYYKRYALPDLVASLFATVFISALIIPAQLAEFTEVSRFSNLVGSFKSFHIGIFYEKWGFAAAALFVFAVSYAFKLLAGLFGLKKWRAAWLTYN